MKEETMFKIVNEINDALRDLKYNQCNVDTKGKNWETYYGLDDGLIKYIRKIEKQLDQYKNNWEELKIYLEQATENLKIIEHDDYICYENVLNKMKELKEDK